MRVRLDQQVLTLITAAKQLIDHGWLREEGL